MRQESERHDNLIPHPPKHVSQGFIDRGTVETHSSA
jgi:hypothetical protein